MTGKYAQNTTVSVEKTRAEIETILARYGADSFAYFSEPGRAAIAFSIPDEQEGTKLMVRMTLPLPRKDNREFTHTEHKQERRDQHRADALWEQACRSSWRSLYLVIKAKLEACAIGISTIEREFLADIMLPGGQTVGDWVRPQLPEVYQNGGFPKLLPGSAA